MPRELPFLLALLVILVVPESRAFTPPLHYAFKLPRTAYALGQHHIHSPEHLAAAHLPLLPGLRLLWTAPPTRFSGHTMVSFNFTTPLGPGRACMFTARPDECRLYLTDAAGRPLFLARLAVAPDPDSPRGHVLRAHGEFLREPTWLQRLLAPAFIRAHAAVAAAEARALWGYRVPDEDANLRAYRSMVYLARHDPA